MPIEDSSRVRGSGAMRTAVVTGGTRGIGLGMAKALAGRGYSLALTYSSDQKAAGVAEREVRSRLQPESRVMVLKGDTSDPGVVDDQVSRIREELGPVTVLVNNAGIMPVAKFEDLTDEMWRKTIDCNLTGAFYWCSRIIPDMKAAGFGRIVNVASIAARGGGVVGPHYAASKAGLVGITRYAARELGCYGITVNALAPAFIEDAGIFVSWSERDKESLQSKVVTNRIGRVEDCVRALEYLLDSPFVTGATLDICGGAFMI